MGHISFLDPQDELPVDESLWVVAVLRKPKGTQPEHAFIMVEGCNPGGQVYFIRYDLFVDNDNPAAYIIHISDPKNTTLSNAADVLLSDIFKDEEVTGQCWSVSKSKANELHKIVLEEKNSPGTYNLLGNNALLPKTAGATHAISPNTANELAKNVGEKVEAISGKVAGLVSEHALKPSGHNCFTWAREVLYLLNIPEIQHDLPKKAEELVLSVTSRHVKAKEEVGTAASCRVS